MESGTLPPPTMLLHSNDSFQNMSSAHSPMNQYSDLFASKQTVQATNKTTKRKFDDIVDPSSEDFDSLGSALKPQKIEQSNPDSERSLSRTEIRKRMLCVFIKEHHSNRRSSLAFSSIEWLPSTFGFVSKRERQ
jgi:hypothetical protein